MSEYAVTVSVTFNYDTEDGLVSTLEEAVEDALSETGHCTSSGREFDVRAEEINGIAASNARQSEFYRQNDRTIDARD